MAARAAAVALYTFVELGRRRLLVLFLVLEGLLVTGIGIAPLVIRVPPGEQRSLFLLSLLSGVAGGALLVCAIGLGMSVIRGDLDSGAVVAILTKPISRLGYAAGKVAAAAGLLIALDALFAIATLGLLALAGGTHEAVVPSYFAVLAADAAIWMVVVMALTVHLHNVLAAVVAVGILFVQGVFGELHTLVQTGVITAQPWIALFEAVYWLLPRPLASNLEREVAQSSLRLHPGSRSLVPLTAIPGASSAGDVIVWLAYLAAVCALLYLALRRKQV